MGMFPASYYGNVAEGYLDDESAQTLYVALIWIITAFACASVVTGLDKGIKYLASLASIVVFSLWFITLCVGDTPFYLNTIVQQSGLYLQHAFTDLAYTTDAFAQQGSYKRYY